MKTEIRISGLGGQGVVLAGHILGKAAAYDGKHVTQTQSYGAEARGSQAKSEILISDQRIGYPLVRKCDLLIAMNQGALEANLTDLKEQAYLILDSTNVQKIPTLSSARVFTIPATETAEKTFGTKTYANMIILGATAKLTRIVTTSSLKKAVNDTTGESSQTNQRALREGEKLAHTKKTRN